MSGFGRKEVMLWNSTFLLIRENVPVSGVCNTSQGIIPGHEGGEETKIPASFDDWRIWFACSVSVQVADTEKQEREVEEEEEQEEGDGRLQSTEEHECGEDEPALVIVVLMAG